MQHNTVIEWQLEQLETDSHQAMSDEMQAYVAKHPDLAAELATLTEFWQSPATLPPPPSTMRARFYQSLANWQQPQPDRQLAKASQWWNKIKQPLWLQAAMFTGVFVLGMLAGHYPNKQPSNMTIINLQQEVANLSSVMAMSMLTNQSASQRLAGVSYSKQANLADPVLLEFLLKTFAKETSTAVKLSIVNVLQNAQLTSAIETDLIQLALNESHPLVQMALTRLVVESASALAKQQLIQQLQAQPNNQDVQDFLQLITAQQRV